MNSQSSETTSPYLLQMIDWRFAQIMQGMQALNGSISGRMEDRSSNLNSSMNRLIAEVKELKEDVQQQKEEIKDLMEDRETLIQRLDVLEEMAEATEMETKRCNLKFFGVSEPRHQYMTAEEQMLELLNDLSSHRDWEPQDINRAFRVGERRQSGDPRPLIVQFHRWTAKMEIMEDKVMRDRMRRMNIRFTSDLTTRQRSMVEFYRQQGKMAFYRNGKLQVMDRRRDDSSDNRGQRYEETWPRLRGTQGDWRQTGRRGEDRRDHEVQHREQPSSWDKERRQMYRSSRDRKTEHAGRERDEDGWHQTGPSSGRNEKRIQRGSRTLNDSNRNWQGRREDAREIRNSWIPQHFSYQSTGAGQSDKASSRNSSRYRGVVVVPGERQYSEVVMSQGTVMTGNINRDRQNMCRIDSTDAGSVERSTLMSPEACRAEPDRRRLTSQGDEIEEATAHPYGRQETAEGEMFTSSQPADDAVTREVTLEGDVFQAEVVVHAAEDSQDDEPNSASGEPEVEARAAEGPGMADEDEAAVGERPAGGDQAQPDVAAESGTSPRPSRSRTRTTIQAKVDCPRQRPVSLRPSTRRQRAPSQGSIIDSFRRAQSGSRSGSRGGRTSKDRGRGEAAATAATAAKDSTPLA